MELIFGPVAVVGPGEGVPLVLEQSMASCLESQLDMLPQMLRAKMRLRVALHDLVGVVDNNKSNSLGCHKLDIPWSPEHGDSLHIQPAMLPESLTAGNSIFSILLVCILPFPSHLLLPGDGRSPLVCWEEQSRVPVVNSLVVCQLGIFLVAVVKKPIFVWNQSTIPESYNGGLRLLLA